VEVGVVEKFEEVFGDGRGVSGTVGVDGGGDQGCGARVADGVVTCARGPSVGVGGVDLGSGGEVFGYAVGIGAGEGGGDAFVSDECYPSPDASSGDTSPHERA
jgi:hypothetical protein